MNLQKKNNLKSILDFVTSTKVVLGLFGLLICFLVPATIFTESTPTLLKPVKVILTFISFTLLVCTIRRLKSLRLSTLIIHIGSIIILAGGLVSSFGYVATVNIYEGTAIDTVFNWKEQRDVPLGYNLRLEKVNLDFHPVDIKIGVMKNGQKADLVMTRTGDSFIIDQYSIQLLQFDPFTQNVHLDITTIEGDTIGSMVIDGQRDLPPDFLLDFKLVAFKDPNVRRMWVDLELRENEKVIIAGSSEVNHPLKWQGMQFFLTQVDFDDLGRPYAGIQISKDPGIPYVYFGFFVLCLGLLLALKRWYYPLGARKLTEKL